MGISLESPSPSAQDVAVRSTLSLIEAHKKDCIRRELRASTLKDLECGYAALRDMGELGQKPFLALKRRWTEDGMSDSGMNRRITHMKQVTKWGAGWSVGLLETDPLSQLQKIPRGKKKKLRTFTLEDARKIIKAVDGSQWYWPFVVYFSTGLRKMDLMLRVIDDFNPDTHILTVPEGEGHKTDHEDKIPVGKQATQALISRGIAKNGPLFPSPKGGFYNEREPHRALTRACKAAGVQHGGCHAMRRCAATQIARMDNTGMASLILGHSDSKMSLAETLYIAAKPSDAVAAVEALEDALLGV